MQKHEKIEKVTAEVELGLRSRVCRHGVVRRAIAKFGSSTARPADLLVHGDGWDYRFRRTTHHGVFDFYVRQNMSAGSGTRYEYQFDGKVYQQVDSITGEQY